MSLAGGIEETADFSADAFVNRAAGRLLDAPPAGDLDMSLPPERGDHDLNPDTFEMLRGQAMRRAAVLVPIVARAQGAMALLTLRPETMPSHAGQVAFPGGKIEDADAGPLDAALREAEEEIGLDRSFATPLGYLDLYMTGSGFRIVPAVALVRPDYRLDPDPREVADVFEVPLSFLMAPQNHQKHTRRFNGRDRHFYAMPYGERYIWGATAGIIRNLYDRIYR